jgi:hypothetical protein
MLRLLVLFADKAVTITTKIVSSNTAHVLDTTFGEKFVSDLRQVGGFLRIPPPIKLTATI